MPPYEELKLQLTRISEDTAQLLDQAEKITELADADVERWKATCQTIARQAAEETMRIAVVGAIKSGKSTFVNTLYGGDYLKRGAGVVTSIVTRVRSGPRLAAHLFFKPWDDVNGEIDQAAVLLPGYRRDDAASAIDIRRAEDRRRLQRAVDELAADQLIINDTRSPGSTLLSAYLSGFERVHEFVAADAATLTFEDERFPRHRDFVGDDALAVYLKDVLLHIDHPGLGEAVEVADCQGSDAPNPLHLAMIQDYLTIAHLTLYVISSRTGIRQADIRFLSMIRKMGILENVAFVINCDLSEHDTIDDLRASIARIVSELGLICSDPPVFAFSALFQLMSQMEPDLSRKDRERLDHWRRETPMVDFVTAERIRFDRYLTDKIRRERSALLLKNHLERLEIVAVGIANWIRVNRDFLARDAGGARDLAVRLDQERNRLERLKLTVKNTLDGSLQHIKRDLRNAVDRFFDSHEEGVVDGIVRFLHGYQIDLTAYDESLKTAGFAATLYRVYQSFKQVVDAHMAESVTPQVIRFIKTQEAHLMTYLDEIAGPFGAMIDEALSQYADAMADVDIARRSGASPIRIGPDLERIRSLAGLTLPPAATTMRYSAQIKTEAIMRFGFYKIVNLVRKAMRKQPAGPRQEQFRALASGVKRMKRETERSLLFHMRDYRENIKHQYLLKLADAAAAFLNDRMIERFQHHGADLSRLATLIGEHRLDKESVSTRLEAMEAASRALKEKIGRLRTDLQLLNDGDGHPAGNG